MCSIAVFVGILGGSDAGWSSLAARRAHNPKVVGSNPTPATRIPEKREPHGSRFFLMCRVSRPFVVFRLFD